VAADEALQRVVLLGAPGALDPVHVPGAAASTRRHGCRSIQIGLAI
jgi:hypothetical protein